MVYFIVFILSALSTALIVAGQVEVGVAVVSYISILLLIDIRDTLQRGK